MVDGTIAEEPTMSLATLTRLMELSCEVSDAAMELYATEHTDVGMLLMEAADRIADEIDVLAERGGYRIDEVIQPLLEGTRTS